MKRYAVGAALFTILVQGASVYDHELYPSFSDALGQYEYDW